MVVDRLSLVWGVALLTLAVVGSENVTKSLVETDDAYILEADLPEKDTKAVTSTKTGTSTRLFTGNTAIDGAVVGLGVGVIGSLLVGKLLEEKNKCNPRGRRDTASTRFLPGLFGGGSSKCPPPPYQQQSGYHQNQGYQQQNSGYRQPNSGYQQPNSGYQQPTHGYQQSNSGYRQPTSGYQQQGYRQPNSGYQQPNSGYRQPNSGNQQPNSGYKRPNSGYQQPTSGYQPSSGYQSTSGYQQPNSGYRQPNQGYQQPNSGYQPNRSQQSGFSQTNAYKATPNAFSSGLQPVRNQAPSSSYQSPQRQQTQGYHPGIVGRSLPKTENSKVNFGK